MVCERTRPSSPLLGLTDACLNHRCPTIHSTNLFATGIWRPILHLLVVVCALEYMWAKGTEAAKGSPHFLHSVCFLQYSFCFPRISIGCLEGCWGQITRQLVTQGFSSGLTSISNIMNIFVFLSTIACVINEERSEERWKENGILKIFQKHCLALDYAIFVDKKEQLRLNHTVRFFLFHRKVASG